MDGDIKREGREGKIDLKTKDLERSKKCPEEKSSKIDLKDNSI